MSLESKPDDVVDPYQLLVNDEAQKGTNQVTVSGQLYVNISGDYPVVVRFTPN